MKPDIDVHRAQINQVKHKIGLCRNQMTNRKRMEIEDPMSLALVTRVEMKVITVLVRIPLLQMMKVVQIMESMQVVGQRNENN